MKIRNPAISAETVITKISNESPKVIEFNSDQFISRDIAALNGFDLDKTQGAKVKLYGKISFDFFFFSFLFWLFFF